MANLILQFLERCGSGSLCEAQTWVYRDSLICQSAQGMSVAMTFLVLILEDVLGSPSQPWSFVFSL